MVVEHSILGCCLSTICPITHLSKKWILEVPLVEVPLLVTLLKGLMENCMAWPQ